MKTSALNLTYFTKYCYAFKNNRSELAKEIAKRLKDGCSVSDSDIFNLLKMLCTMKELCASLIKQHLSTHLHF
jgi:hypothetical protein